MVLAGCVMLKSSTLSYILRTTFDDKGTMILKGAMVFEGIMVPTCGGMLKSSALSHRVRLTLCDKATIVLACRMRFCSKFPHLIRTTLDSW